MNVKIIKSIFNIGGEMKKLLVLIVVLLGSSIGTYSQGMPQPTPQPVYTESIRRQINTSSDLNRRSENMRMAENFPIRTEEDRVIFLRGIQPHFRESTDAELEFIAPNSEDREKYASFLKKKNTGLIKLIDDKGCASNKNIVNASPKCEGYTMPGAGSSYSFRFGDYRIFNLSDINYKNNRFESLGVLTHGIMVNLGDVSLEDADLDSKGMNYLVKLKPANDFQKAAEIAQDLTKGIKDDGFTYASILPVAENSTYALRSIAYNGESLKVVEGLLYNEMELDRREDIIVVFRVVRLNPNDNVTILWKELKSKKSPELKQKK